MPKLSAPAQKRMGEFFHKMKNEDKPQAQKVAIAYSKLRSEGYKAPKKSKRK